MECKELEVSELKAGQLVTVLRRKDGANDRSWIGEAFKVLHVQLPFVVVGGLCTRYGTVHRTDSRISFDTRALALGSIDPEYVAALTGSEAEVV